MKHLKTILPLCLLALAIALPEFMRGQSAPVAGARQYAVVLASIPYGDTYA